MKKRRIISAILAICLVLCLLPRLTVRAADVEGTFTAATLNVDGLPSLVNSDGPGKTGSTTLGQMIAAKGWDIVAFEEDFEYNSQLMAELTGLYNFGTYRGTVKLGSILSRADTDGMNLLWKKSLTATGEAFTKWNSSNGNLFNGCEDYLKKGYRYYEVKVAEEVYVDVYILHMDSGSKSEDITDRESQMDQLVAAIKASNTHNPIIVMGDTNSRYTREHLEEKFVNAINADARFTAKDVWVEKVRNGVYPEFGSGALVDDTKGDLSDTDIPTPLPQAEVVDKIFYINNTDSCVTLSASSYTVDTSFVDANGKRLADHFPVVAEFSYEATHSYVDGDFQEETCTTSGYYTYNCEHCLHSVTDVFDPLGHYYRPDKVKNATCTAEGYIDYKCQDCGATFREELSALGHAYREVASNVPGCTSDGRTWYQCARCSDTYWIVSQEPLGHDYINGQCTRCGEYEEGAVIPDSHTWGAPVASLTDGHQYAIVFPSTYPMGLSHDASGALSAVNVDTEGELTDNLVWTVKHVTGGYTISTEVGGQEMYLARTRTMANTGYKLTLQKTSFVWTVKMNATKGTARVTTKVGTANYTLRYYSSTTGWIVSSKAADIQFYSVNG